MRMTSSVTRPVKGCTSSAAAARSSSTTRRARIVTRNARESGPPKAPGPGSSHPRPASCSSPCPIAQVRSRRSGCSRRRPERELSHAETSPPPRSPTTLTGLATYFLRLGATGFGGPVALANYMRRDLVEARGWVSEHEYDSGLAIAAACPGPLAYQLGVYCGYVRFGVVGGLLVAVAFGLAPFLIVVAAAAAYTAFADNWQLRALFYGVGPVVVALILKACWNLGLKTLRRDRVAWAFALIAGAVTVVVQKELAALFIIAGVLGAFVFAGDADAPSIRGSGSAAPPAKTGTTALAVAAPIAATSVGAWKLFLFFFKTGCLVFGSGLVIVPFLKTYVVDQYHWLGNREFLDAVAIGMISPGPVVITATFVGYVVGGLGGAVAATVGIFSPAVLFTVLATPVLLRYGQNRRLQGFIRGVTVTVVGVLVGTTYLVARTAIGDVLTAAIALLSLVVLMSWKKCPDPLLVAVGAVIGLAMYRVVRPDWLMH
ncbi:MAG: chromate transporter [Acidobacteria bacterium]|nr:MAG: chromate transporter [Acidobacteriota bacterium]